MQYRTTFTTEKPNNSTFKIYRLSFPLSFNRISGLHAAENNYLWTLIFILDVSTSL